MIRSASMLLCLAAAAVTSGCTGSRIAHTAGPQGAVQAGYETTGDDVVIRGQSYTQMAEGTTHKTLDSGPLNGAASFSTRHPFNKSHMPVSALGAAIDDKLHNTQVGYYDNSTPICGGVGSPMDPMCPTCPGGMYGGCRHGACGPGGVQCVRNHHSYRVEQPSNLSYPQAGAVGGAVVYPYYTHKGPSDFFRDDPTRR